MHNFFPSNDFPESGNAQSSPLPESSNQVNQATMKKTLFYDFLPSKAVEDAERAQNIPHRVAWQLIEIRDGHPLPASESRECPTLIKVIDELEVFTGKLSVLHHRAFDYVFRHWPMPIVQDILTGGEYRVKIFDSTDYDRGSGNDSEIMSPWFCGENICFAKWRGMDHYFLNLGEVFRTRRIAVGDVIHCSWDTQRECFVLKVVRGET